MALINCPECNREVSDKADICPNCGFGVAKYIERQNKISKIQEEAEKEAYLYVKKKKREEEEEGERVKRIDEDLKSIIYNEAVCKYGSESLKDVEKAEELFSQIAGWKDADVYLKNCKDRVSKLEEQKKIRVEKYKRIRKKAIAFASVIVICVGIIMGCHYFYKTYIVPKKIYDLAISYIEEKNYEEALSVLIKLDRTKDVLELINLCKNSLKYEEALNFAESKKYREAIEILAELGDFKDSISILANYCLEADYLDAEDYVERGDYKNAILLFEGLEDYKDAKKRSLELSYQFGIHEFENENYVNAKYYLEKVSDNQDVAGILSECEQQLYLINLYSTAQNLIVEGNLYDALSYLNQLPSDFKDATEKIALCNKYKNVVGEWKCVGYDALDYRWITDERACKERDFIVKVDNDGNLFLANYEFDYKNLEYTGTTLKWESVFMPHTLNISTGILTYTFDLGGKDWTFKMSYVHSK